VDSIDEPTALLIARELIEQHGDDGGHFLQDKIDALTASGDLEQLSAWFVTRNAVAHSLESDATVH